VFVKFTGKWFSRSDTV